MNYFIENNKILSNYIHIDSSKRIQEETYQYDNKIYNLSEHPLEFTNKSTLVSVYLPNHTFNINDDITLSNVVSKNLILENVLKIKKNSMFIKIFNKMHGLSLHGQFNPNNTDEFLKISFVDILPSYFNENEIVKDNNDIFYILKNNEKYNLFIELSNIKGSDYTRSFIGNIPINYLNKKHKVFLIFKKENNFFCVRSGLLFN